MVQTSTNQTPEELFDAGLERYRAGEGPDTLLPVFKEVCERSPKSASAWTCLAWLYLLADKPNAALKAAQKAVKISPQDPQARINLAVALLETGGKGVRQHVEMAGQVLMVAEELRPEVEASFQDGIQRKPNWVTLQRVYNWLANG